MRSANLLNDFAFKYVFGEDCKEANDALKSLLTVFLERKVEHVVVKNSEMVKDYTKMKSPRLDLLVEFDDQTSVDLEMQLRQTKDNLLNRFNYYLARLHGSQDMEGKSYSQLKETIVMVFFNLIIADDDDICSLYTMRKYSGIPLVKEEKEDRMKLMTIEMPKVDLHKPLEDMNEQEKMIYYFLNCHKGMDDSKIKMMIESDEANDALKSLLTVFLERKVEHVVVKNSEMVKDYTKMKSPRLDLLVEFDDQTSVDLEMQLRQTKDNLLNRFNYYLARLHGSQDMEGKSYSQLKETIVMVFFNLIIADDDDICSLYTMRKYSGIPLVKEEKEDRMKLMTIEMPKVDLHKPLEDMNEQEKMIYYFLNCHKGMDDSKIKMMIESDEII